MQCIISLADHSGHSEVIAESVEVAQEALTGFLDDCIRDYGYKKDPPVWAKRLGEKPSDPMDLLRNPRKADLRGLTEIFIQPTALVGG